MMRPIDERYDDTVRIMLEFAEYHLLESYFEEFSLMLAEFQMASLVKTELEVEKRFRKNIEEDEGDN